uniref:CCR4-Not transcription complex subunit 1-like n=1 Tax=Tanacetum cinerariifolium TaxID=118510 RepID=A0A6L2LRG1_TANCI|nr:CCR4-Not transcription complex subunit 1-like [Tanacetum cinerariifolium]
MLEYGGKTPILTTLELEDIGYKVVACHLSLMGYPSVKWRSFNQKDKGLSKTKNLRESKGLKERIANKNDKTTGVAYINLETENRCSSPPSMNISHDDFELTVVETPNYNEPLTMKKEPINEAYSTTVQSVSDLLFYSERLEIQHIEASMNSKCILDAANARLNAANSNLPSQNVVSSSSALANSPAFVRPSRTPTSTRFVSTLIIEKLVASAERRETLIYETIKGLGPGCIFTLTAIAKLECGSYGRTLVLHARGTGFDSSYFLIFLLCD